MCKGKFKKKIVIKDTRSSSTGPISINCYNCKQRKEGIITFLAYILFIPIKFETKIVIKILDRGEIF